MRIAFVALLALLVPSPQPATASDPMRPVLRVGQDVVRRDLFTSHALADRLWMKTVRDLAENRIDVDALEPGTPVSIWSVDDELVAFMVDDMMALRAQASPGTERWVLDDGTSLDGPMLAQPVKYLAVTSKLGARDHPLRHRVRFHAGTDYAAPVGTPVVAVADGTVKRAGRNWSAGKFIVLKHDDGHETKYLHLSKRAKGIKRGARVRQGEVIGAVGKTGRVTGAHLHFEVRDATRRALDPVATVWPSGWQVEDSSTLQTLKRRRALLLALRPDGGRDLGASLLEVPAELAVFHPAELRGGVVVPPLAVARPASIRSRNARRRPLPRPSEAPPLRAPLAPGRAFPPPLPPDEDITEVIVRVLDVPRPISLIEPMELTPTCPERSVTVPAVPRRSTLG